MCHACNERNEGEDRLRTVKEGKVGTIGPKGLYIVHCFSDLLIFFLYSTLDCEVSIINF